MTCIVTRAAIGVGSAVHVLHTLLTGATLFFLLIGCGVLTLIANCTRQACVYAHHIRRSFVELARYPALAHATALLHNNIVHELHLRCVRSCWTCPWKNVSESLSLFKSSAFLDVFLASL